ncbi:dolichyl-phosphate-mannose-protein mannosyltransferase [Actinomycetospora cinnamomea]|uniref:Polyprenol-phosphate-mannose--protein mannosyltransferase n=2 Tax=Actinomycetospora cinnamomea TaxID=663609 RepID=A0A2U1FS11_9PSEU|nr:dolichyl-phosphate-mannose-protein mannosyltransferase [Actinomycetospora cinnamomea]
MTASSTIARPGPAATARPAPQDAPAVAQVLGRPMPTDRLRGWVVALVLTLVGGVVRFWDLGRPTDQGTPIFDEKHYVPQAWQVLRNGGYEDNPGYELVVHPPLSKQLMAVGQWIFGYDPVGWRAASALAGTLCILAIVRIARRLTRSTLLGGLAGVLLIADGVSHVSARVGMIDVFPALFVLLAFGALLVDRDDVRARLATVVTEGRIGESVYGPRLGVRWWRVAAGACLGLSLAAKWSGLYYIVFFGLLLVGFDAAARRAAGVTRPFVGTLVRDVAPALWACLALPMLIYVASWLPWIASETGTDRHAVGQQLPVGGPGALLPDWLRGLVYYSTKVLEFHATLDTPRGSPHPWESKPWTWPMGLRPMLYYYESGTAEVGCGSSSCVSAVMLIGTPAMWWLALPALGWSIWRVVTAFDWRHAAVLVGYGAGFLPWFTNLDRQMYFFYMTPVAPFLVLAIVLALGEFLGRREQGLERRRTGTLVVGIYTGLVVANFVWLWPILVGTWITADRWNAELWLPSWR